MSDQQCRWSCAGNHLTEFRRGFLNWLINWLPGCLPDHLTSEWLNECECVAIATDTLWVCDWQSCLATVSVPPKRGRELSVVSTDQRRQLLILYLSIIFVFHRQKTSERVKCVRVCEWVSSFMWCRCMFTCGSVVCMLPISLWLWEFEHAQCAYTVASVSQTHNTSILSSHCSLIG